MLNQRCRVSRLVVVPRKHLDQIAVGDFLWFLVEADREIQGFDEPKTGTVGQAALGEN